MPRLQGQPALTLRGGVAHKGYADIGKQCERKPSAPLASNTRHASPQARRPGARAHHVGVCVPRVALDARQVGPVLLRTVVVKAVGGGDELDAAGWGAGSVAAQAACGRL